MALMDAEELYDFTHRPVDDMKQDLWDLGWHALTDLSKAANLVLKEKHHRHHTRKYKNKHVREVWSDDDLQEWFGYIKKQNKEHWVLFMRQFFYGLRISEIQSITLSGDVVRIQDEKMQREEDLPLILGTENILEPIQKNYTKAYLEKLFNQYRHDIGNRFIDKYSEEPVRYRYHSHGLRKTAANIFAHQVHGDKLKVQTFLRHDVDRELGTAAPYLQYDFDEFKQDINDALNKYVQMLI